MPHGICMSVKGQRTSCGHFFPFTFMWVPGTKLRTPGLLSKCFYPLSYPVSLRHSLFTVPAFGKLPYQIPYTLVDFNLKVNFLFSQARVC